MNMETIRCCPQCQQPLPINAPEGLCPQCLLKAAAAPPSEPLMVTESGGGVVDIGDPVAVGKCLPQFEILELLGRGGMGVVYKARQKQLDRLVALKILPPSEAHAADFVARFTREARSLAKLSHPNIVTVYDFGESGGLYYFIMEYVDGANLRQMMQAKQLTAQQALAIVPKICDALQFAHEEGVMHRDIKPENILLDKKGRVKIADFGLAKLLRREQADHTLTMSGMTLGTPRYMAPEQMDKPESVDHRADIYSLGVVFYEMLTGELPMGRFAPPSQKVQVDVRLDEIVLHALERDVERRYQHVSEVRDDVENVTATPGGQASPPVGRADAPAASAGEMPVGPTDWKSIPLRNLIVRYGLSAVGLLILWFALRSLLNGPLRNFVPRGGDYEPISGFIASVACAITAFALWPAISGRKRQNLLLSEPSTGKAALAIALGAIAAHAFQWHYAVEGGVKLRISNLDVEQVKVSVLMLALSIGSTLLAVALGLPMPTRKIMRGVAGIGALTALIVQITFLSSLGVRPRTWHNEALQTISRSTHPAVGLYATIALTALAILFFALCFFEEKSGSDRKADVARDEPHLSRCALWGAIWAPLGIIAILEALFCIYQGYFIEPAKLPPAFAALMGLILVCGAPAPIGTTLLGAIAIWQIKRSGGRLYGLRIAAADALFFPLLALGSGTVALTHLAQIAIWTSLQTPPAVSSPNAAPPAGYPGMSFMVLDSIAGLLVCFFTARAAWRKIAGGGNGDAREAGSPTGPKPPSSCCSASSGSSSASASMRRRERPPGG